MKRERYSSTPLLRAPPTSGEEQSSPSFQDEKLELQIEATRQAFLAAKTREARLELQETMRQLISLRSPWQVAKMEKERGLA